MAEFRMPSLGADMEAGTLVEWLVKPGDRVKRGDVVAVVETQKGSDRDRNLRHRPDRADSRRSRDQGAGRDAAARGIRTEREAATRQRGGGATVRRRQRRNRSQPAVPADAAGDAGDDAWPQRKAAAAGFVRHRQPECSPGHAGSISPRSQAAAPPARSCVPMSSVISAKLPLRRKRSEPTRSISMPCEQRSPPPWRDRSGKSRIIISPIRSTSPPASNGSPARMRRARRRTAC